MSDELPTFCAADVEDDPVTDDASFIVPVGHRENLWVGPDHVAQLAEVWVANGGTKQDVLDAIDDRLGGDDA